MFTRFRPWLLSMALASLASPVLAADAKITYDQHILPLLKDKCVGCHNQDKKRGGLILNNYARLMEGGSSGACVKPGDPDNSLLFALAAHKQEPFMPPSSPTLPKENLDLIAKWISGGALENNGSKVVMPDKPKVDFTLPSIARGKPATVPMPPASLRLDPVGRSERGTAITALASSPWAPLVAVGGVKQVLLYNPETTELLGVLPFPEGVPHVLKFSRNGSLLLAGGGQGGKSGRVVVWSIAKGERLFEVGDESDTVLAADISPDQTHIALGGPGKVVRLYSTRDGKLEQEIRKHTDWITAIEFSPDGVLLATGDRSGGILIWEAFTAREYHNLRGPTAAITDVSWRPDSNVLAVASEDSNIRLYEMENGNQIKAWGAHGGGTLSVKYGQDGRIVSTGRDRVTKLWDGNGTAQRSFEALSDIGMRVIFSHDTNRVLAGDWNGQLAIWNTADAKRLGTLSANPPSVADQLALAEKELGARIKARETLTASANASKAALAKLTTDLTAAQKMVVDTGAALNAATAKQTQAVDAATKGRNALTTAANDTRARAVLAQALAEASAKVRTEAEKAKTDASLTTVATRAKTLSDAAQLELTASQTVVNDLAATSKKLDADLAVAQQALPPLQTAAANATKTTAALTAGLKPAQDRAAADQAALTKIEAEVKQSEASVARWKATMARVASK
jgi:Planctomycete cytochrome C/Anaphase-promoting complex subunit 4 WD40 domain/WD domain, G-beta repeat